MTPHVDPLRVLAVCAGIGGLERGIELATGGRTDLVGCIERDPYAASVLMARMESAAMAPCPVWCGDVAEFDATPYVGKVDALTAGFPCQPFSLAGSRKGTGDSRWLWPGIARLIRMVGPRYVFLENVRGMLAHSGGFGQVLGDLADCGFDAEWSVFAASEAGAPHRRERVFILAGRVPDAERDPVRVQPERGTGAARSPEPGDAEPRDVGEGLADTGGARLQGQQSGGAAPRAVGRGGRAEVVNPERARREEAGYRGAEQHPGAQPQARGDDVADPDSGGPQGGGQPDQRGQQRARRGVPDRRSPTRFPPGPGDPRWAGVLASRPDLAPALGYAEGGSEGSAGIGSATRSVAGGGQAQPAVRGMADGIPDWVESAMRYRTDRLRVLGNAVVPDQAALAFTELARRLLT